MAQIRKGIRVIIHPHYDSNYMKNDIALILLDVPLNLNRWVRPACVPEYDINFPAPFTTCVIIGWGVTSEHGIDR